MNVLGFNQLSIMELAFAFGGLIWLPLVAAVFSVRAIDRQAPPPAQRERRRTRVFRATFGQAPAQGAGSAVQGAAAPGQHRLQV